MNQQIIDLLRDLGVQLGTTAQDLWRVIVGGQRIEGIFELIAGCLLIVAMIVLLRVLWKSEWDTDAKVFGSVFLSVLFAFGGLFVRSGLIAIYAPEYSALKFILNRLGHQ